MGSSKEDQPSSSKNSSGEKEMNWESVRDTREEDSKSEEDVKLMNEIKAQR